MKDKGNPIKKNKIRKNMLNTNINFFFTLILSYLLFSLRFLYIKIKFFTDQFLAKSSIYKIMHSQDIKISHRSY
jgi:hypothetical protein